MIKGGGGIGVSFFFVLSGFLISYLLFIEKINSNKINILNFYKRRAFRIWPLYFLLVIIVFFLPFDVKQNVGLHMVGGGYDFDWRFSFTFLENYKMIIMDQFPKTTPLSVFWSLCIEEHFYIVWGLVFYFLPLKHLGKFLLFCVVLAWFARGFEFNMTQNLLIQTNDLTTNLDYFSLGGGLALLYVNRGYIYHSNSVWSNHFVKYSILLLMMFLLIFQNQFMSGNSAWHYILRPTIIGLIFTILISFFICPNSQIKFNVKWLNYLGQRSYGLYVFHIIAIHIAYQYCIKHNILLDNYNTLILFIAIVMGSTIAISILSFRYFERPILKLRERI